MSNIKIPPYSGDAEQSVLGALLLKNDSWLEIEGIVQESDFYLTDHKAIFSKIKKLSENGAPFDAVTLSDLIEGDVLSYVVELANNTPSAANIKAYANVVKEKSMFRDMIKIATQMADSAYNPNGNKAESLLNNFQDLIFNISKEQNRSLQDMDGVMRTFVDELTRRSELEEGVLNGLTTGLRDLDAKIRGLKESKLIVVGGRPSMGKTTLALNICQNVAKLEGKDALVFSMEMDAIELGEKMAACESSVSLEKLDKAELDSKEWERLSDGANILRKSRIFIDDTPGQTYQSIRVAAKQHAAKNNLGIIMIDYLQLMEGEGMSPNIIYGAISRNLKKLSKELKLPIVLLSQLNRKLEERPDKRPKMSDLRESGAIEQDADMVMFVYRDEIYYPDSPGNKGITEIICQKFRGGKTFKAFLKTELEFSRFSNRDDGNNYIPYEKPTTQSRGGFGQ